MAIGYGTAQPKPESRKRVKGRKKRGAAKVVKNVRAEVVQRAAGRCERCSLWTGDFGHAHHRIPRSRGGAWTVENIQYLCAGCHLEAHTTNAL